MKIKRFNKHYEQVDSSSRVKMHKSGKTWVKTVMSRLSLFRIMRKGSGEVSEPVTVSLSSSDDLQSKSGDAYLKAILAAGALTGLVMWFMLKKLKHTQQRQ